MWRYKHMVVYIHNNYDDYCLFAFLAITVPYYLSHAMHIITSLSCIAILRVDIGELLVWLHCHIHSCQIAELALRARLCVFSWSVILVIFNSCWYVCTVVVSSTEGASMQYYDSWDRASHVGRPVARIFRRGVTWMSNLHKHARLAGSGGMLPKEIFRN